MKNPFSLVLFMATLLTCPATYAQELHTHSNAASINNESNSTTGWGGSATITAVNNEFYSGSYSLKLEAPSDSWNYRGYGYSTTPNEQYLVKVYAKSVSSNNPRIYLTGAVQNQTISITSTNWTEYSGIVEASGSSMNVNVYTGTPAITGDVVYIDHVSITPLNGGDTQAPSSPTLSSSSPTENTVDLSWSGATDNVGVTGYKVFKDNALEATLGNVTNYQVTGLSASTTYQFKLRALDAAGNESVDSNSISITTDAGSGNGNNGGGGSVWSENNAVASYAGEVAIGRSTVPSGYQMAVEGKIRTREVRVDQENWPDYVFKDGYDLLSIEEIQKHINEKGHLPNIPSATEINQNGIELGEMDRLLVRKIEELTLHIIQQDRQIKKLFQYIENNQIDKNQK
nr:fibronectin type III domain-containing protein [uncultured Allomuricauda sp.]